MNEKPEGDVKPHSTHTHTHTHTHTFTRIHKHNEHSTSPLHLLSILKNGSRVGYFSDPHSTVCSRMCGAPVESVGVVRNAAVNTLFSSSLATCSHCAPVPT